MPRIPAIDYAAAAAAADAADAGAASVAVDAAGSHDSNVTTSFVLGLGSSLGSVHVAHVTCTNSHTSFSSLDDCNYIPRISTSAICWWSCWPAPATIRRVHLFLCQSPYSGLRCRDGTVTPAWLFQASRNCVRLSAPFDLACATLAHVVFLLLTSLSNNGLPLNCQASADYQKLVYGMWQKYCPPYCKGE